MWLNCYKKNKITFFFIWAVTDFQTTNISWFLLNIQFSPFPHIKKAANYPYRPNDVNNFHHIIWYYKCVCGILLRKLNKYSKYTMKTCQENLWHIYMMCYFNSVIGWRMQGCLKGQSHILKTAIMVPRKHLSKAIAATVWPRGRRALRARRPNVQNTITFIKKIVVKRTSAEWHHFLNVSHLLYEENISNSVVSLAWTTKNYSHLTWLRSLQQYQIAGLRATMNHYTT